MKSPIKRTLPTLYIIVTREGWITLSRLYKQSTYTGVEHLNMHKVPYLIKNLHTAKTNLGENYELRYRRRSCPSSTLFFFYPGPRRIYPPSAGNGHGSIWLHGFSVLSIKVKKYLTKKSSLKMGIKIPKRLIINNFTNLLN